MTEPSYGIVIEKISNFFETQINKSANIDRLLRENQVLGKFINRDAKGGSTDWSLTVPWLSPRGIGPERANAQATARGNAGRPQNEKWKGNWAPKKASLFMEELTLLAASRARGEDVVTFLEDQGKQLERVIIEMGERLEEDMWSGPGCATATFVSCTAGVAVLANKMLSREFKVGDPFEWSANDGSSTGHVTAGALGYVAKVNENTGTVSFSATDGGAVGQPAGWGTGAGYVFRQGQFGGGTDPVDSITGIRTYLPAADPTTTLLNIDRTKDVVLWGGVRIASGEIADTSPLAILRKLVTKFSAHGYKMPGRYGIFVHPEIWDYCGNALEAQGNRSISGKDGVTGLEAISLNTAIGTVPIFSAPRCPYNNGYLINSEGFRFRSLGKWPQPAGAQFGQKAQVDSSADMYEWRLMGFGALQCEYPGTHGTCVFPGSPSLL
jgi:hypothetical protein